MISTEYSWPPAAPKRGAESEAAPLPARRAAATVANGDSGERMRYVVYRTRWGWPERIGYGCTIAAAIEVVRDHGYVLEQQLVLASTYRVIDLDAADPEHDVVLFLRYEAQYDGDAVVRRTDAYNVTIDEAGVDASDARGVLA